jgi:hypothetical protein
LPRRAATIRAQFVHVWYGQRCFIATTGKQRQIDCRRGGTYASMMGRMEKKVCIALTRGIHVFGDVPVFLDISK